MSYLDDSGSEKVLTRVTKGKKQVKSCEEWLTFANFDYSINGHGFDVDSRSIKYLLKCEGLTETFAYIVPICPSDLNSAAKFLKVMDKHAVQDACLKSDVVRKCNIEDDIFSLIENYRNLPGEQKKEIPLINHEGYFKLQDNAEFYFLNEQCILSTHESENEIAKTMNVLFFGPSKDLTIKKLEDPAAKLVDFLHIIERTTEANYPNLCATLGSIRCYMKKEALNANGFNLGPTHFMGEGSSGKTTIRKYCESVMPMHCKNGNMQPNETSNLTLAAAKKKIEQESFPHALDPNPTLHDFQHLFESLYENSLFESAKNEVSGSQPKSNMIIVWGHEMNNVKKFSRSLKTKGVFLFFEKEVGVDKQERKALKDSILRNNVGEYSGIAELFVKTLDVDKFDLRVKKYMSVLDEKTDLCDTGHEELDERVSRNYAQAMAGFKDILLMLPIGQDEIDRQMNLLLSSFTEKQLIHLMKNIETYEDPVELSQDLEENKERFSQFFYQCTDKELWENVAVKTHMQKETSLCINEKIANKPFFINYKLLFPNGKRDRNVTLRKKDDKNDENTGYDFFHYKKNDKNPVYGKGIRPYVWEVCQTDLEDSLINLIMDRVKQIGVNVIEFSTMMIKVREFYDEKYLTAVSTEDDAEHEEQNVYNDKRSENQDEIVRIITRFLTMDKKCQKSFMSFVKDSHGDKLSGMDIGNYDLKVEKKTQTIAKLYNVLSNKQKKKLSKRLDMTKERCDHVVFKNADTNMNLIPEENSGLETETQAVKDADRNMILNSEENLGLETETQAVEDADRNMNPNSEENSGLETETQTVEDLTQESFEDVLVESDELSKSTQTEKIYVCVQMTDEECAKQPKLGSGQECKQPPKRGRGRPPKNTK